MESKELTEGGCYVLFPFLNTHVWNVGTDLNVEHDVDDTPGPFREIPSRIPLWFPHGIIVGGSLHLLSSCIDYPNDTVRLFNFDSRSGSTYSTDSTDNHYDGKLRPKESQRDPLP